MEAAEGGAALTAEATAPAIAIVIPVFKHSALLPEAIEAALAQRFEGGIAVVIVDDGCPFEETRAVASAYALADARVTYLRKRNGGLSSARNFGIDFALRAWPSLRAVYFLDADNRLTPVAMANAFAMLEGEGVDWVYPSIDKFGLEWSGNYAAPYSRLAHVAFDNICEAGSLVARRVFDAGLRFDEGMRQGYEDWEFWLQALSRGFRGKCHPSFGFEYRQRAESMVRDSGRMRAGLLAYMRGKHRGLWSVGNLLRWEHEEAPRFALFRATGGDVAWFSDPELAPRMVSPAAHAEAFAAEAAEPETFGTPPILVWLPEAATAALRGAGLLAGALWQLERLLARHDLVAISLGHDADAIRIEVGEASGSPVIGWAARQGVLREGDAAWIESLMAVPAAHLTLHAPFPAEALARPADAPDPRATFEAVRAPRRRRWSWRDPAALPQIRDYPNHLAGAVGADQVLPRARYPGGRIQVGFALPSGEGGRLRVAAAVAGALRAAGCATHLCILGATECRLSDGVGEAFDSVAFLAQPMPAVDGGPHRFMGRTLALAGDLDGADRAMLGMLGGLDVLVASGTPGLSPVLAELRRLGVRIIGHIHGGTGREAGDATLALAFEHAHDLLLAATPTLADWLHGEGVPEAKLGVLAAVPPAPRPVPPRAARRPGPLRALLLREGAGSPEAQKAVVLASRMTGLPVEWSALGDTAPGLAALGVRGLPATRRAEAFAEADLLIWPECAEATAMAVLEAQRAGCIPVLPRAGTPGALVAEDRRGLVELLRTLCADPGRLERLSGAALDAARAGAEAGIAPLLERLAAWFPGSATAPA